MSTSHLPFLHCQTSSHTPIRPQSLPTHPPAPLPAQEMHHIRNLLRSTDPVRRAEARNHLQHLLALALVEEVRARGPGGDGVDADVLAHQVFGHDAHHLLDGAFGGVVQEVARHDGGGLGEGGGDQDHAGAGGEMGEGFLWQGSVSKLSFMICRGKGVGAHLDQEIRTFDIELHGLVEVVLGGVLEIFHG